MNDKNKHPSHRGLRSAGTLALPLASGPEGAMSAAKKPTVVAVTTTSTAETPATTLSAAASQSGLILDLAKDIELFHTPNSELFACVRVDGHLENRPLMSKGIKRWLQFLFFQSHGAAPSGRALAEALGVLEGRAMFDSPTHDVHVRYAECDGKIYVDLANESWSAVEISRTGWRIVDKPPVRFLRTGGMMALPTPERGGTLLDLRPFLNVALDADEDGDEEESWRLFVGWLLGACRPTGPYAVLAVQGPPGSAKSSLCRAMRALVDPSTAPLRRLPRSERDAAIGAHNAWVQAFDNVSGIREDTSDTLCVISTGGGLGTRELYTDKGEALFHAARPVIINGIDDLATRSDLADRSVVVRLGEISEEGRKDETAHWRAFELARPRILGAIYDALSVALANVEATELARAPRMADFARWVSAAEPALGWPAGAFVAAYENNRTAAMNIALESDPVASELVQLLHARRGKTWEGTATALLAALTARATGRAQRSPKWPAAPNALTKHLKNRAAAPLRRAGITVTMRRVGHAGERVLHITEHAVSAVSTVSAGLPNDQGPRLDSEIAADGSDAAADGNEGSRQQPAAKAGDGVEQNLGVADVDGCRRNV